jgi:hypothetical protein
MGKKFKRRIQVTVARMMPDVFFAEPSRTNAIVIRDAHIKFKVEKTLEEKPNTCEIEIFNLAETTRAAFTVKPSLVRLEAGYESAPGVPELVKLFEGDLTFGPSAHEGVDWITRVSAAEGGRALANAHVSRSYKAGVNHRTVIAEVAKSMGLKVPTNVKEAKELSAQFVSGVTLHGPSQAQMTKILKPHGMGWSIQNGQLQVLRAAGVRADEAIVISAKTGMVGSPILDAPKEPGKPATVKVKTLLEPGLLPGGRMRIIAEGVDGLFRIDKVTLQGSNFDTDYYSEVDGTML